MSAEWVSQALEVLEEGLQVITLRHFQIFGDDDQLFVLLHYHKTIILIGIF